MMQPSKNVYHKYGAILLQGGLAISHAELQNTGSSNWDGFTKQIFAKVVTKSCINGDHRFCNRYGNYLAISSETNN